MLRSEYRFDPTQVIAAGYSNGANIAASLLLLRPEVLAGAILLRPMIPLIPDTTARSACTGAYSLPVAGAILSFGPRRPRRLAKLLQDYGAEVSLHWSDQGHELNRRGVRRELAASAALSRML